MRSLLGKLWVILFLYISVFVFPVTFVFSDADQLQFKVIQSEELIGMISVKVKITNISNKHINGAYVTCVCLDQNKEEIAFQSHYVIKSTEGGLKAGRSVYFQYVINVKNPSRVKYFVFNIERIF